jgi:hypothetical protein
MLAEAHILLLTNDAERRRRWAEMLAGTGLTISMGLERLRADDRVDVIVADHAVIGEVLAATNQNLLRGQPGIISIGASPIADVSLPSDFSRRELKLACLLLAEVIGLRRQIRREQKAHKLLSRLSSEAPQPDARTGEQRV